MTVDVHDSIAPLAKEWDDLADRTGAPPFARPGWFAAWWGAFGSGEQVIVAARHGRRLTGVLPLRRRNGVLASPTNAHTPAFGVLAEDDASRAELAGWTFAQHPRRVQLDYVDAADPALPALRRAAAGARHRVLRTTVLRSPYALLTPGQHVDRRLGGKPARNLRRNRRRLGERGQLAFELVFGPADLDAALIEGFRVEASGWKAERGTAIASSAATRAFYAGLARWAAATGLLRLGFLRLDGRAIAFAFAFEDATAWYLLKGGYEPAYRRYAPGKLLVRELVAAAIASGAERFEFLGATEPWKLEWTGEAHERVLVRTYAPTVLGAADHASQAAYLRYGKPLAKRALARVR